MKIRMIFSLSPKVKELLEKLPKGERSILVESLILNHFGYKIEKQEDKLVKL